MIKLSKEIIPQHTIDKLLSRRLIIDRGFLTPCWEYTGARKASTLRKGRSIIQNHGLIRILGKPGILIQTHVLAAILWLDNYNHELWILHKCDNPPCFNPEHLHQGDNSKNMSEMWSRGRRKRQLGL